MASLCAAENTAMAFPPGLTPPPGLEPPCKPQHVAPPPGLEQSTGGDKASLTPMYVASSLTACPPVFGVTVVVSSLPNHLLNKAMMSATLEQARLDEFVLSCSTKPGAQRGEATITFSNADAAVRCARHFNGRRWDASGLLVSAKLLPVESPTPMTAPKKSSKPSKPSFALSAEAPAFIPGALQSVPVSIKEIPALSRIGSDVSTEDGDSTSSSDEKEVPVTT